MLHPKVDHEKEWLKEKAKRLELENELLRLKLSRYQMRRNLDKNWRDRPEINTLPYNPSKREKKNV